MVYRASKKVQQNNRRAAGYEKTSKGSEPGGSSAGRTIEIGKKDYHVE